MIKLISTNLTLVIFFMIGGCTTTPSLKFYTLSSMAEQAKQTKVANENQPLSIAIAPIKFPDFLDRRQIVTRSSPYTLKISETHRWGGTLSSNFLQVFGENLSILLDTDRIFYPRQAKAFPIDYRVTLNVKAFEGELGKEVVLDVDWVVIDQRRKDIAIMQNSTIRELTNGQDYEAFVSAQSRALTTLSRQIANSIK
ncbi:MAG: membrane integrity-associated transporter subunit PqiC [Nitrosomonas sp.]|nr:membrane integrity-associated transporter subunit PqiC [Nitrosomonas sp.]